MTEHKSVRIIRNETLEWNMEHDYQSIESQTFQFIPTEIEFVVTSMEHVDISERADRALLNEYLAQSPAKFRTLPEFFIDILHKNIVSPNTDEKLYWFTQRIKGRYSVATLPINGRNLSKNQFKSNWLVFIPANILDQILMTVKQFNTYQDHEHYTQQILKDSIRIKAFFEQSASLELKSSNTTLVDELDNWFGTDIKKIVDCIHKNIGNLHVFYKLKSLIYIVQRLGNIGIESCDYLLRPVRSITVSTQGALEPYYIVDAKGDHHEIPVFAVKTFNSYENADVDQLGKEFMLGYQLSHLGLISFVKVYGLTTKVALSPDKMWMEYIGYNSVTLFAWIFKKDSNFGDLVLMLAVLVNDLITARKNGIFVALNVNEMYVQDLPHETVFTLVTGKRVVLRSVIRLASFAAIDPSQSILSQLFELLISLCQITTRFSFGLTTDINFLMNFITNPRYNNNGQRQNFVNPYAYYEYISDLKKDANGLDELLDWIFDHAKHNFTVEQTKQYHIHYDDVFDYSPHQAVPELYSCLHDRFVGSSWKQGNIKTYFFYVLFEKGLVPKPTIEDEKDLLIDMHQQLKADIHSEFKWLENVILTFHSDGLTAFPTFNMKNVARSIGFITTRLKRLDANNWISLNFMLTYVKSIIEIKQNNVIGIFRILVTLIRQQQEYPQLIKPFNDFVGLANSLQLVV